MFVEVKSIECGRFDIKKGKREEVEVPVLINTDQIQYIRPSDDDEDQCMIQFSGGFPIFVHGTLESVGRWLNGLKE